MIDPYFINRYRPHDARTKVWREIVQVIETYMPHRGVVLELGPGYCDFINQVSTKHKIAVDISAESQLHADDKVEFHVGDCENLSFISDSSVDVVFASNLFEHLEKTKIVNVLSEVHRVLRPRGRLMLLQPNFRYCYAEYFDDYTHISAFSHVSLGGILESQGFKTVKVLPRFLPLTMESAFPKPAWVVRLYLKLPIRPFGKQMLVIAEK